MVISCLCNSLISYYLIVEDFSQLMRSIVLGRRFPRANVVLIWSRPPFQKSPDLSLAINPSPPLLLDIPEMAQQEKPGRTLMSDASSVSRTFQPVIYHSHPNLSPPTFPTRVSCGQQACTNGTTRLYIQLHLTHLVYLPHPVSATRTNKAMPHHCRCQLHKNLSEATRRISFVPRSSLRSLSPSPR